MGAVTALRVVAVWCNATEWDKKMKVFHAKKMSSKFDSGINRGLQLKTRARSQDEKVTTFRRTLGHKMEQFQQSYYLSCQKWLRDLIAQPLR